MDNLQVIGEEKDKLVSLKWDEFGRRVCSCDPAMEEKSREREMAGFEQRRAHQGEAQASAVQHRSSAPGTFG